MNAEEQPIEEPDVTPLINVNVVILVMVLLIASHAARLLPLAFPRAQETKFMGLDEAATLTVRADETFRFAGQDGLSADALAATAQGLAEGTVVVVGADAGVRYESLVQALDAVLAAPGLRVAFGGTGVLPAPVVE